MADLIAVASSGAVGKQVFATDKQVILRGFYPPNGVSGAVLVIRDGNASGEVKLTVISNVAIGFFSTLCEGVRFDKGMHVKVTGDDINSAYLLIN